MSYSEYESVRHMVLRDRHPHNKAVSASNHSVLMPPFNSVRQFYHRFRHQCNFTHIILPSPPLSSPLFCYDRVHESVSRSMACSVPSSDPQNAPFLTFPAHDFSVTVDTTQAHTSSSSSSNRSRKQGSKMDSNADCSRYVPGALFSSELESATTMFNFLPVFWSEKEHYSAAVTGLQQLVLPSPTAHFPSLTTHSAPSSSSSTSSSAECSSSDEAIAVGVSEYFDYLKGCGWHVPPSCIARLAVTLHSAAHALHAYLYCGGTDDDDDGDDEDDGEYADDNWNSIMSPDRGVSIGRDRVRERVGGTWKRRSSRGGRGSPSVPFKSSRTAFHAKNRMLLCELTRTFSTILRAHLEDCCPLGSVFLFLSEAPTELPNINGFELCNFDVSMQISDLELKLLRRKSYNDLERYARKRRNSDLSIQSQGSPRGDLKAAAFDDDITESDLLLMLSKGKAKTRNESAHKRQREREEQEEGQRQGQGQGQPVALKNGEGEGKEEEEVEEEKSGFHDTMSLYRILGSLDAERNAADRLTCTLEIALNSVATSSFAESHSPLLRKARGVSIGSKFPPKPNCDVELFLSKCKEEESKFQNLSKLASSIISPNVMQE